MAKASQKADAYRRKVKRRRAASLILAAACVAASIVITLIPNGWKAVYSVFGLTDVGDQAMDAPFSFHVLDVGKADAMLISCEGSSMLIDCGMADDGERVARYLQKRGVSYLDYAVCTHPDSDHIGGYEALLRRIGANVFLEPPLSEEMTKDNVDYQLTEAVLKENQILQRTVRAGDRFSLGAAQVTVLSPAGEMDSTNNSSLVLKVVYGETTFLLMGDAEEEVERNLLAQGEALTADVLKVGHHGSKTSTTESFLTAVSPTYGVISVGQDSNELPKDEILQRLERHQVITYRTDLNGVVVFTSDGETITAAAEQDIG